MERKTSHDQTCLILESALAAPVSVERTPRPLRCPQDRGLPFTIWEFRVTWSSVPWGFLLAAGSAGSLGGAQAPPTHRLVWVRVTVSKGSSPFRIDLPLPYPTDLNSRFPPSVSEAQFEILFHEMEIMRNLRQ